MGRGERERGGGGEGGEEGVGVTGVWWGKEDGGVCETGREWRKGGREGGREREREREQMGT